MIGFASGIYFSKFHQSMLKFAEKNLPDDKKIFLICTYGGSANYRSIEQILNKKHSKVIGKFGCKGYDTSVSYTHLMIIICCRNARMTILNLQILIRSVNGLKNIRFFGIFIVTWTDSG